VRNFWCSPEMSLQRHPYRSWPCLSYTYTEKNNNNNQVVPKLRSSKKAYNTTVTNPKFISQGRFKHFFLCTNGTTIFERLSLKCPKNLHSLWFSITALCDWFNNLSVFGYTASSLFLFLACDKLSFWSVFLSLICLKLTKLRARKISGIKTDYS